MKTITVVQARMGSSRLPGKVLKDILGQPLLIRMIERLNQAKHCGTVVVATSDSPSDDSIEALCKLHQIPIFRGSELDLLDRHYQCGLAFDADIVAKIPSDCPLICPDVVDEVFLSFDPTIYEYYGNLHPPTYPDGNDVEIMTIQSLKRAASEATRTLEREHTTPYFWENPDLFKIGNYVWPSGLDYSMSHRFTIDYPEDYEFVKSVYEHLYPQNPNFRLTDILDLLDQNPDIYDINSKYAGVNWYRNHLDDLKTIDKSKTKLI